MSTEPWIAPYATTAVTATVSIPGSKSITNRALVLAALAAMQGAVGSTISGALRSRDTDLMIAALQALGIQISSDHSGGPELAITGVKDPGAQTRVDCGLAGTVLRFLPPVAALRPTVAFFDGDAQARVRPITVLLVALRSLGVDIRGDGVPFSVCGQGAVAGGTVTLDASASSQFVSGLLLSGAAFTEGLSVIHSGASLPSAPHIAMTVAMLGDAGVVVDTTSAHRWQVQPGPIASRHWKIEPDLSNAVPFLAAAIATGGTVRIAGWPKPSIQPAETIIAIATMLGSVVEHNDSYLQISGQQGYSGFDVDLHDVGELAPAIAALAALAQPGSVSRLTGIAHLRGHETDRLAALTTEINALGGNCTQISDGLRITATPLHSGTWHSYADHRMAMAGAIIGLRTAGVMVENIATTGKTLPHFVKLWQHMLTASDVNDVQGGSVAAT